MPTSPRVKPEKGNSNPTTSMPAESLETSAETPSKSATAPTERKGEPVKMKPKQDYSRITQDSPLLKLPPELRNRIFELVIWPSTQITDRVVKKLSPGVGKRKTTWIMFRVRTDPLSVKIDREFKPPALLQVCHEIRHEASMMYYGRPEFEVNVTDQDHSLIEDFVQTICDLPASNSAIKLIVRRRGFGPWDQMFSRYQAKWAKSCATRRLKCTMMREYAKLITREYWSFENDC